MKEHIICQRLYGLILMLSCTFLSDALSLKGKRLDFYGRADTYVRLTNMVPELSRFTACIDLVFVDDESSDWMAFSYTTNNTFLGREDIDLGLAGDHQQLILYNLGKTFYIRYHLTPFQWYTICLIWDGVKGRLELFLNTERILVMMDQPQNLTPNGTLILGHFLKNWDSQVKSTLPAFTGSLYYFQLWDRVLENEELTKCLGGNVVSWDEDIWLINKVIPTVDMRLRCFVYENITIQEMSTTHSQQMDLTTPSQVIGLKPQETEYSSTAMFKSKPVFATGYATISYPSTASPPLERVTAPQYLKTSTAETASFTADILSTSASATLPTKSTSTGPTTNSMKITKSPSPESTRTTKMAEAIATETFHPTTAPNFPYTSGFTKNSIIPKTSVAESQSAIMKTTPLFSSVESAPISTTSWPKQKSTGIEALSIFTASQEVLASTDAGTVPRSMVEQTSATTAHVGTLSAFPPGSVLISTVALGQSVFPRNQTAPTLATTDTEITSTVHSKPLPTRPIEKTPMLRTAEAELTSTDFQDVSSPRTEDTASTFVPAKSSSMALSFSTSSPFTRAQNVHTVSDAETTHTASTPGVTLAPTVPETMLPPTTPGPIYTQKTPTDGENMLSLNSTRSASTFKAYESDPTSITGDGAHLFSTSETTWTSRPDQTLLTLEFHGSASNAEHSSTTTTIIISPEAPSASGTTPIADAIITADATADRSTTALSKLTTSWFANFSTVSRTTSVTTLPEFKLTTLLLTTTPTYTAAGSEVLSTPKETVVPPVAGSTVAYIEPHFSTEESASETILTEMKGTLALGGTTAPVAESTKTQRYDATVTRKETTSHSLEGRSTRAGTMDLSPFATMLEATEESAQMVTASATTSPFPGVEKLTTPLDNKTATTEVRGSGLSTKSMKTTPESSYDGTTEISNSTHTYAVRWTSEAPPEENPTPSPSSGSTQTFSEALGASTAMILGTGFATVPIDMTAMSLSAGILPPQPTATHSSAAPVPSASVTTASVSRLGQTASAPSDTVPTHRPSIHTTSEATVTSVRKTPMTILSLTETPAPSWRPPTPVATKAETPRFFTSADTVTPWTPTLVCSKSLSDNIPVLSSTHVISSVSTPVMTQPVSQMEETSTRALSLLYTLTSSGDVVSLATSTTETSVVDKSTSSHTSTNKLTTSVDDHSFQPSTHLGNTLAPTLLVADVSTLSSGKEQVTTSLGNTSRTMAVTEMSPSKNPFISDSQSTSSLEMTDTGFAESTTISSHQTPSPADFPLTTPPDQISASSPTSGSMQTTSTSPSSHTVDAHIPEMSTSLGKIAFPSQALRTITFLSPEKEGTSALSVYTPGTEKMIVSATSVTPTFSYHQDTSFVGTITSRTTRISNPVNINTTLSNLLSSKIQTEMTSVASPISESTQTSPEFLPFSTTGLSSASFTLVSTGGITAALSAPNAPTALLGKTSMATSIPIYQMSSQPLSATAFGSKRVSETPTTLVTKSSKTALPDRLKSPSPATSGPMSEMSSVSVNGSALSPSAVSFDTSAPVGSFSSLLSSTTPRTTTIIPTTTLDAIPRPTSESTLSSPAFITSEVTEVSSRITPTSFSSPTESAFPSVKTIPTTLTAGIAAPSVGTVASSLLSSRNTEAISSIPKTTFLPFLATTQQSSQRDEIATLGTLSGTTNASLFPVSSSRVTAPTNSYSGTDAFESVLSSTPSYDLDNSLNIQVSPSLSSFKSTPGYTKSIKATTYLSSNTEKMTSLSENTSTEEPTKGATSVTTPVSYPPWTPSIATPPSLTSFLFSPHHTEAKFSTPKTFLPLTSQMVEFPILGTRTTPSNTQSLLMTSWNTPTAKGSQFPIFASTHIPTRHKMETEIPYLVPGSLSTFTAPQTGLVSGGVTAKSSISTSEMLPTLGMSDSPSSSISSRSFPITLTDMKHTFGKTATSVTPRTTLPSNHSGATSGSILSKATSSPMVAWISSTLPLGSPLATVSSTPHIITSSTVELSESTFLTSGRTSTPSFTNFTTPPFATVSTTVTKNTPTPAVGSITTGSQTSLPLSVEITDDSVYISKSPGASSRTTVTANSKTVSQPLPSGKMSRSPPATDHTLSISSMHLHSAAVTSAWNRIPAASASSTLFLPKPTLDSLPNITTKTPTATGASFPLTSTRVKPLSPATVPSLLSSSSGTIWLDSTTSFISMETSTSLIAAESTVSFYSIEMSFTVFNEEPRIPITSVVNELAENWLNSILQDSEFALANLAIHIKSRDTSEGEITMDQTVREGHGMATISYVPYSCVCQVILKTNSPLAADELVSRIRRKIHGNLTHGNFTQGQLMLLVKSEHVAVEKLEPGSCEAHETVSKYKGTYKWLRTNPTEIAHTRCVKNRDGNATRVCSISMETGKSQWEKPKLKQCKLLQGLPDKIVDLTNITISDENAGDVAEHILNLINESPSLEEDEAKIIVSKVSDISQCHEISMNLTQTILQIISAVLGKQNNSASDLHEVRNEILRIIERAGHKMEFLGRTANLTAGTLALVVLRVDHTFEGMAFSIRSYEEGADPEIYLGEVPLGRILASIYLPKSLRERIPLSNLHTILFNFFGQTSLFKTKNVTKALTTFVVSASISDTSIQNLADPVVITLQHVGGNQNYDQVHCAFWDFASNNGQGGWNSSGCKVKETNVNHTICQCDHLTHFGVLMDLSRSAVDAVNEQVLELITYIGCGISSIFLGIAMVTYIAFHNLRKDHPSKILINLCAALLMLNVAFLVNSWSTSFQNAGLCVTAAVALHYFLLVSLTWMGLEGVHMYVSLVRVFNIYVPNYILKFCLVGWGIPGIMVAITLSVKKDLYGPLSSTTPFCWIKDDSIFYASVVAYFCLVFLTNLCMFCTVLAQLNSMNPQSQRTRRRMIFRDLKGAMSLTFLLGLTWGFAFFAWGPVRIFFLYLFAIFNTLQGFLIFVFYCVMKESVRDQWQIHLCCGWSRLDNSSDGDSRCGLNVGHKQERLKKTFQHKVLTPSFNSTATSSTFKSLGSAQCTPSEISFPNGDFEEDP